MSRVLITGGAGFLGFHLARALAREGGRSVVLVDDLSRGVKDPDLQALCDLPAVRFVERDLLRPGCLDDLGTDYREIHHLAAIIGVAHVLKRPFEVLRDNAIMLFHVLAFAKRQESLGRLVFASTSEVYAGTLQHFSLEIPTPEDSPLAVLDLAHPRSSYMLSKLYGEALCRHAGIPFSILRPHNVYGPRMGLSHVIPELLARAHGAKDGGRLEVFSPNHRRTFCYVEDAVEMIRRVAERPECAGGAFNIGCDAPEITMRELAEAVIGAVGRRLEIVPGPDTPGSPVRRCPDMRRTNRATGYSASVGLPEGIRRTYEWYRPRIFDGGGMSAR